MQHTVALTIHNWAEKWTSGIKNRRATIRWISSSRIDYHRQSLRLLKKEATSLFRYGLVARQVGKFSGCSIHSLWATPPASSFCAKFRSWVSPFTSNVTCNTKKNPLINTQYTVFSAIEDCRTLIWNRRKYLVHFVEIFHRGVLTRARVILVKNNGGNGRMAALRNHASQWPFESFH